MPKISLSRPEMLRALEDLPNPASRADVQTARLLTRAHMSRLDSSGQGPAGAYRSGAAVVYSKRDFVAWFKLRYRLG